MIAKTLMKILVYIKGAKSQGNKLASRMKLLQNLKTLEHFLNKERNVAALACTEKNHCDILIFKYEGLQKGI